MKFNINKENIVGIIILIIGALIAFFFQIGDEGIKPLAKNGVLDVTHWDFQKDGPIKLDGEWEFYWKELLTYDDFYTGNQIYKPDGYLSVPSVWNNYSIDKEKLSGEGYATYRLRVKTENMDKIKGIKILTQSTAYRLMVDDEIVAESGVVGKSKETSVAQYRPQVLYFDKESKEFEIIIHISNYSYSRGGFWQPIYIGTPEQVSAMKEESARREMFIIGAVISMLIYHIFIYGLHRRVKSII